MSALTTILLSMLPAIAFGKDSQTAVTNSTLFAVECVSTIIIVAIVLIMLLATIAFCFRCCCFKKYDQYYFKRKEGNDRVVRERMEIEQARPIDSSCAADINNEIDNVNKNVETVFSLIQNGFVLGDKACTLIAHILVKSYFELDPTKTSSSLVIESFRKYLISKYNAYLGNAEVRTNNGTKTSKEQFGVTGITEIANIVKRVNKMDTFEEYLDMVLPSINLIVLNLKSNNISMGDATSVNIMTIFTLLGGIIASGLVCFRNASTTNERKLVRQEYLRWADKKIVGFHPEATVTKISLIAQSWDEAISELNNKRRQGMEAELVALFNELEARLAEHDDQRKSIQTQIESECVRMRAEIDALEDKINSDLQSKFASEDKRLQVALNDLREILARGEYGGADAAQCVDRARAELLVTQSYKLSCKVDQMIKIDDMYSLSVTRSLVPKTFSLERRKVDNLSVVSVIEGRVFLRFDELFNPGEVQVLKENGFYCNDIKYVASCKEQGAPDTSSFGDTLDMLEKCFHPVNPLKAETNYALKIRVECNGYASSWSDEVVFVSSKFSELSAWRHCPKTVDERFAYVVSPATPRIATRLYGGIGCWSTVVGNVLLPENKTLKWSIRLLKSRDNGRGISVGVAPFDVPLNAANNGNNCGWYFDLCTSILRSGPPHHYSVKKYKTNYSPKKKTGVEVLMNTTTGDLSFSASGKDPLGVAYQGIPLDKPLVPCVLLYYKGDSIELVDPVLLEEKGDNNNNKDDKDNIEEDKDKDKDKDKNDNDDNKDDSDDIY